MNVAELKQVRRLFFARLVKVKADTAVGETVWPAPPSHCGDPLGRRNADCSGAYASGGAGRDVLVFGRDMRLSPGSGAP